MKFRAQVLGKGCTCTMLPPNPEQGASRREPSNPQPFLKHRPRNLQTPTCWWVVREYAYVIILSPKGPCRYMVYNSGPKGFPYTYFKAQVYPIYLHGPFGIQAKFSDSLAFQVNVPQVRGRATAVLAQLVACRAENPVRCCCETYGGLVGNYTGINHQEGECFLVGLFRGLGPRV